MLYVMQNKKYEETEWIIVPFVNVSWSAGKDSGSESWNNKTRAGETCRISECKCRAYSRAFFRCEV